MKEPFYLEQSLVGKILNIQFDKEKMEVGLDMLVPYASPENELKSRKVKLLLSNVDCIAVNEWQEIGAEKIFIHLEKDELEKKLAMFVNEIADTLKFNSWSESFYMAQFDREYSRNFHEDEKEYKNSTLEIRLSEDITSPYYLFLSVSFGDVDSTKENVDLRVAFEQFTIRDLKTNETIPSIIFIEEGERFWNSNEKIRTRYWKKTILNSPFDDEFRNQRIIKFLLDNAGLTWNLEDNERTLYYYDLFMPKYICVRNLEIKRPTDNYPEMLFGEVIWINDKKAGLLKEVCANLNIKAGDILKYDTTINYIRLKQTEKVRAEKDTLTILWVCPPNKALIEYIILNNIGKTGSRSVLDKRFNAYLDHLWVYPMPEDPDFFMEDLREELYELAGKNQMTSFAVKNKQPGTDNP